MEAAFENLKKEGRNGVDNLIQWIKSSKLIDDSAESEAKARRLFDDVKNKENVELEKFQEVVGKLAAEQNKTSDQVSKMLADGVSQLQGALASAANAFKSAMSSK